ncbi:MAG: hypothetical protein KGN31_06960 [Betaproteobacteria bacterium]|nr:hypothetical protein [Betaproteobacteria bacterium]
MQRQERQLAAGSKPRMGGLAVALTRPSLQRMNSGPVGCLPVVDSDCARHTLDVHPGTRASNLGCGPTRPVALWTGCHDRRGRHAACPVATVVVARAGNQALSSKIAVGPGDMVENAGRTLRIA